MLINVIYTRTVVVSLFVWMLKRGGGGLPLRRYDKFPRRSSSDEKSPEIGIIFLICTS